MTRISKILLIVFLCYLLLFNIYLVTRTVLARYLPYALNRCLEFFFLPHLLFGYYNDTYCGYIGWVSAMSTGRVYDREGALDGLRIYIRHTYPHFVFGSN
jgi:hypothetical protein